MSAIIFISIALGLFIGFIFSLLFIAFDSSWKKILSTLFTTLTSGTGIWFIYDKYHINDYSLVFTSIGIICISFVTTFIVSILIFCRMIMDKKDKDIIRIRDVFLGQKNYIKKYYEARIQDINGKLNITALETLEKELREKERQLNAQLDTIKKEEEEFEKTTSKQLRIRLPENKNIVVTKEFIDLFPAYVENIAYFIKGIQSELELFLNEYPSVSMNEFKVFLKIILIQMLEHLFGGNVKDVRVHFRFYNDKRKGYEKLVSVIGGKEYKRDLTFIPIDKANMIIGSYKCKRALIKSYNLKYDYESVNSTTWTEYMTGTFYNITRGEIPCLSFGISVKNATKFKNEFKFLNYCKFETFLQDVIEQFNDKYNIENIIYNDNTEQ